MADLTGQTLGRYHILEKLGEGGMATVYKAFDTRLETDVAVKVIRTERLAPEILERSLKRFEREAKALARLTHPNIVGVKDFGEYEGKPYLVMEYLPSGTLKSKLGRPIPWQEALRILIPVTRALHFAHSQNMIHRDVKPSNILITLSGEPMLTDFGIAKILDIEETADLTGTGMGIGTPEYMAPEQWTGRSSPQSDQYSLGVVLYEMLTGRKPYSADTPAAILLKQANDPLPRPSQYAPGLPPKVERLLLKMLARDAADRYTDLGELAGAMGSLQAGVSAPPERSLPPGRRGTPTGKPIPAAQTMVETDAQAPLEAPTLKETFTPQATAGPKSLPRLSPAWTKYGLIGLVSLGILAVVISLLKGAMKEPALSPLDDPFLQYAAELRTVIVDARGVGMHLISAGEFMMGSDTGEDNAKPSHLVTLGNFYMDRTEVTFGSYLKCVEAGACDKPGRNSYDMLYNDYVYSNYPAVNIGFKNATAYCEWRGARLPTEAEWEKAARGTDGRSYPWGEGIDCSKANYGGCTGQPPLTMVARYPDGRSPYGLYDMAGNVFELVADLYNAYPGNTLPDSSYAYGDGSHVIRGGSWYSNMDRVKTFARSREANPDPSDIGFRCARSEGVPAAVPPPTEPPATEAPVSDVGTPGHPIEILFIPFGDTDIIEARGRILADALTNATGLTFEVVIPTSQAAAVEEMCGSPDDVLAFIPGQVYAYASSLCNADAAFMAVHDGFPVYWSEYIVRRDSNYQSLADLQGASWAYPDTLSPSGYMLPLVDMTNNGVTPGRQIETGSHALTVTAVYNGDADFGTVYFNVPRDPAGTPLFSYEDYAAGRINMLNFLEVPTASIPNCGPSTDGSRLACDGYIVRDARANVRRDLPDVIQKVRILTVTPGAPNDGIAFSSGFPAELRARIEQALLDFSRTEAWGESIGSPDYLYWDGILPTTDLQYEIHRTMVDLAGYTLK